MKSLKANVDMFLMSVTINMKCYEYISYILVFPADSNAYFMGVPIRCFGLVAALENNNISSVSFKDYCTILLVLSAHCYSGFGFICFSG